MLSSVQTLPVEPQAIPLTAEDVLVLRWFKQLEGADRATAIRFISALALTRHAERPAAVPEST